jgi:preprotein translocase subunit SecG
MEHFAGLAPAMVERKPIQMTFLLYLSYILFMVVSVLLVLIVLIQKGRGGGLAGAFGGGGGTNTAFGAKTGDVLTWVTSILFGVFLLLGIAMNLIANRYNESYGKPTAATVVPPMAPASPSGPSMPAPAGTTNGDRSSPGGNNAPAGSIPVAPAPTPAPAHPNPVIPAPAPQPVVPSAPAK